MMQVFEMIFGIVFVVFFFSFLNNWVKHRHPRKADAEMEGALQEQLQKIAQLEERIQVLEKIVTDGNYDLKRQFKDLETGTG